MILGAQRPGVKSPVNITFDSFNAGAPGETNPDYQSPQLPPSGMLPERPWQKVNPMAMNFPQYQAPQYNDAGYSGMAQQMAQGMAPQMPQMPQMQQPQPMSPMPFMLGGQNPVTQNLSRVNSVLGGLMQPQQQPAPRQLPSSGGRPDMQSILGQMTQPHGEYGGAKKSPEEQFSDFGTFRNMVNHAYGDLYKATRPGYGDPTGDSYDPRVMEAAQAMLGSSGAKHRPLMRDIYDRYFGG